MRCDAKEVTVLITSAYNYYLSTYGNKSFSRHDSHKRSELRDLYNNIVKVNKASPIYKVDMSEDTQKLAIDIKESARAVTSVLDSIGDIMTGNTSESTLAVSENPSLVTAEYVGNRSNEGDELNFTVKQLATSQVNVGEFLSGGSRALLPGNYSFDINNKNTTYEITFAVDSDDNNTKVLNKLTKLINNADIGLKASVVTDQWSQKALSITSEATGSRLGSPVQFTVEENNSSYLHGAVGVLGLNNVSEYPANAVFTLNGIEKISENNTFMIDDDYEVSLNGTSEQFGDGRVFTVKDGSSVVHEYDALTESYNHLLSLSRSSSSYELRKLNNELSSVIRAHRDELEANGITIAEDNSLKTDVNKLREASLSGTLFDNLGNISSLKSDLQTKINSIELNPMEYVNKKIVAYKNPNKLIATPYSASSYSGMMFDYSV